jgi:hypothetical protein
MMDPTPFLVQIRNGPCVLALGCLGVFLLGFLLGAFAMWWFQ